jgi:hypothetical protein
MKKKGNFKTAKNLLQIFIEVALFLGCLTKMK